MCTSRPLESLVVDVVSLNGDYNPLHADPTVGEKMGFGGVILHGLCTWNMACHAVLSTFANSDGTRLRSFGGRFVSPVKPGNELVIDMWRTGQIEQESGCSCEEVLFEVRVSDMLVMSNGRAMLKVPRECRL
jgi:peroxisomal enoyl-CoA hydratase 2